MNETRSEKYQASAIKLLLHLERTLEPKTGFPDGPSWGYAFTYVVALLANNGMQSMMSRSAAYHLMRQNTDDPNFSWEFVVYALQQAKRISKEQIVLPLTANYREKGTRMLNWFLLRNLNKRLCGKFGVVDLVKLRFASRLYQKQSGLILDEFRTRSLQYHAFCLFVLSELLECMPNRTWLRDWFVRGVDFSIEQMLSDGTSLYIGRGQEQIFGYGSLLYALEYCHRKVKPLNEAVLDRLRDKLLGFQRADGSYPLVLRYREPEPARISYARDQPPGWYGYNTLYDYQPFLAYALLKTARLT